MTTTYRQNRRTEAPSQLWSALLALGIAVTILGLLLITSPFSTAGALAVLAGAALVVTGIGEIVSAVRTENAAGAVFFGILLVAAGVVILVWPAATLQVVAVVVGAALIIAGMVRALLVWNSRQLQQSRVGRGLLLAGLSVVIGVMALVWPAATIAVLALLFGIQLVVTGVTQIALGLALRPAR